MGDYLSKYCRFHIAIGSKFALRCLLSWLSSKEFPQEREQYHRSRFGNGTAHSLPWNNEHNFRTTT
jgi:hypothetical protein